MNDSLAAADLARPGAAIGHTVIVKARTGSTNDDAAALAHGGAASGVVVMAEEQDRGRGRLGRQWRSPSGVNLLFSVVLRPKIDPEKTGLVTIAAGVAVARAVAGLCGLPARIKWPNDVRVGGKKIAGILAEAGGDDRIEFVVLGIGINVNLTAADMPAEIRDTATSIREKTGKEWPRAPVFRAVIEELQAVMALLESGGHDAVLAGWLNLAEAMGRLVRAETPAGVFNGTVIGIRQSGALVIREEAGLEIEIVAGDVIVL